LLFYLEFFKLIFKDLNFDENSCIFHGFISILWTFKSVKCVFNYYCRSLLFKFLGRGLRNYFLFILLDLFYVAVLDSYKPFELLYINIVNVLSDVFDDTPHTVDSKLSIAFSSCFFLGEPVEENFNRICPQSNDLLLPFCSVFLRKHSQFTRALNIFQLG
jgi:hypothetical protein